MKWWTVTGVDDKGDPQSETVTGLNQEAVAMALAAAATETPDVGIAVSVRPASYPYAAADEHCFRIFKRRGRDPMVVRILPA